MLLGVSSLSFWKPRFQTVRQEHADLLCIPSSPNLHWSSHRQVHCDSVITSRGLARFSHCSYGHLLSTTALYLRIGFCDIQSALWAPIKKTRRMRGHLVALTCLILATTHRLHSASPHRGARKTRFSGSPQQHEGPTECSAARCRTSHTLRHLEDYEILDLHRLQTRSSLSLSQLQPKP